MLLAIASEITQSNVDYKDQTDALLEHYQIWISNLKEQNLWNAHTFKAPFNGLEV